MKKKYELTDETINGDGRTLHRIRALRDFNGVKKGDLGGFVESEKNLDHEGDCWVWGDAWVYENARVWGDAWVDYNVRVYGNAWVCGRARVYGDARVYCDAWVSNKATVGGDAFVCGRARVYGNAKIDGNTWVGENARVYGDVRVSDNVSVGGNARIFGNARVYGYARIFGNAQVEETSDYVVFKNWWSSGRYFTWTRSNNMWSVGCFYGTSEELIAKAKKDSEESGREYERVVRYVESILADARTERQ